MIYEHEPAYVILTLFNIFCLFDDWWCHSTRFRGFLSAKYTHCKKNAPLCRIIFSNFMQLMLSFQGWSFHLENPRSATGTPRKMVAINDYTTQDPAHFLIAVLCLGPTYKILRFFLVRLNCYLGFSARTRTISSGVQITCNFNELERIEPFLS